MREIILALLSITVGFSGLVMATVWLAEYRSKRVKRRKFKTPIELRTGNKIYIYENRLIAARVVMNLRQDERLVIKTIDKDKRRMTIDYSQILEIA